MWSDKKKVSRNRPRLPLEGSEVSAQTTEGFVPREKIKVKSEKKRLLCVAKH